MKRLLGILTLTLLLTACGGNTVRFSLTFDTNDAERVTKLTEAVQRTVEGRVLAKQKKLISRNIRKDGDTTMLEVTVQDDEIAKVLQDSLTVPFTMSVMKQVDAGRGDIVSQKYGEFKETGIVTKHIDWVTAGTTKATGTEQGAVVIQFTKEGETLLKDIFAKNRGSVIGIFVRGQLMSKKTIDATDRQTSISIEGIPSATLAAAFADDVNVGLHVKFTAAP